MTRGPGDSSTLCSPGSAQDRTCTGTRPGQEDGFHGVEGAFLPMPFLAVTALAQLARIRDAELRLDRLCVSLPRLLSEEIHPQTGQLLGNTPMVWSHAELARAV